MPTATTTMTSRPTQLDARIAAGDQETLDRMKKVVADHLDRFASREAPLPFVWADAA